MNISQFLINQLQFEADITRKFLDLIPEDNYSYKPHEKSWELLGLAKHIGEIPGWIASTMSSTEMDMAGYQSPVADTKQAVVDLFETNLATAITALEGASEEDFDVMWSMKMGDQVMFEMSRLQCLTTMVVPQIAHHRAQLGVYYRMLDIALPATYGPSADSKQG